MPQRSLVIVFYKRRRSSTAATSSGFPHSIENDIGDARFGADGIGIPDEFFVAFGGISPSGLALGKAIFDEVFGFAEQHRNIFLRVHAVADEEWDDDNIPGFGDFVTFLDAWILFEKGGMDSGILVGSVHERDLAFDGFAGVFVLVGAVAHDEKSRVAGPGCAWEREFGSDLGRSRHQYADHAIVRADRGAVNKNGLPGFKRGLSGSKTKFPRNDVTDEVTFADEERDDEGPGRRNQGEDVFDLRLLFPEGFANVGEQITRAQFFCMLVDRRRRLFVLRRAVAEHDEGGI